MAEPRGASARIAARGFEARAHARRPAGPPGRWLGFFPALTLAVFLAPIATGLLGTLLPSFGILPALGGTRLSIDAWRSLIAAPGTATALRLTISTGIAATILSLLLTLAFCASFQGTRLFLHTQRLLAPLLAIPHAAFAIGIAFLLAPSGWIARLLSPWLTGWARPPDLALVQDPWGVAMTFALVAKEVPFLLLMTLAALSLTPAERVLRLARTMGYGRISAWLKLVLPLVYPQIRLPLFAVLAYSLSTVEVALILGPTTPPPLAPLVLRWFVDAELALRFQAAAGAILQLAVVAAAIAAWYVAERAAIPLGVRWIEAGRRGGSGRVWRAASGLGMGLLLLTTLIAAGAATLIALGLVIGCLEHEARARIQVTRRVLALVYVPLLVPQIGFLFGVQILLLLTRADGSWPALIAAHLLFVLPYVFLSLSEPYRALDPRYAETAACLGRSRLFVFAAIKLPMLLRPLLAAAAVGFAVSVGQYLPTIFAGAGRLTTLTTEAIALASGADQRVAAVYAFIQATLPMCGFMLALLVPRFLYRHRRGMHVA